MVKIEEIAIIRLVPDGANINMGKVTGGSSGSSGNQGGTNASLTKTASIMGAIWVLLKGFKPLLNVISATVTMVTTMLKPIADLFMMMLKPMLMMMRPIVKAINQLMKPFISLSNGLIKQGMSAKGQGDVTGANDLFSAAGQVMLNGLSSVLVYVTDQLSTMIMTGMAQLLGTIANFIPGVNININQLVADTQTMMDEGTTKILGQIAGDTYKLAEKFNGDLADKFALSSVKAIDDIFNPTKENSLTASWISGFDDFSSKSISNINAYFTMMKLEASKLDSLVAKYKKRVDDVLSKPAIQFDVSQNAEQRAKEFITH